MKVNKIIWLGDSLKNLKSFPEKVKDEFGYNLHKVQTGLIPNNAKLMKGFKLSVMEITCNFDTNTYRTMYTTKIGNEIYVLHCFQKKSKKGIETPKHEIDLIKQRLNDAEKINEDLR